MVEGQAVLVGHTDTVGEWDGEEEVEDDVLPVDEILPQVVAVEHVVGLPLIVVDRVEVPVMEALTLLLKVAVPQVVTEDVPQEVGDTDTLMVRVALPVPDWEWEWEGEEEEDPLTVTDTVWEIVPEEDTEVEGEEDWETLTVTVPEAVSVVEEDTEWDWEVVEHGELERDTVVEEEAEEQRVGECVVVTDTVEVVEVVVDKEAE